MPKILLFLGSLDPEGEWYPFYRVPENPGIYKEARMGEFITLCSNASSAIPIQVEIKKISLDEKKDTKSIYIMASSTKELESITKCDPRWTNVLEGNP